MDNLNYSVIFLTQTKHWWTFFSLWSVSTWGGDRELGRPLSAMSLNSWIVVSVYNACYWWFLIFALFSWKPCKYMLIYCLFFNFASVDILYKFLNIYFSIFKAQCQQTCLHLVSYLNVHGQHPFPPSSLTVPCTSYSCLLLLLGYRQLWQAATYVLLLKGSSDPLIWGGTFKG